MMGGGSHLNGMVLVAVAAGAFPFAASCHASVQPDILSLVVCHYLSGMGILWKCMFLSV